MALQIQFQMYDSSSAAAMDDAKLRLLERQYKLRVKTGCQTCR